jgi:hypothetical protein
MSRRSSPDEIREAERAMNLAAVTRKVEQALRGLQYGTVQMTVHDGEVVRIERIERIRLHEPGEGAGSPRHPRAEEDSPTRGGSSR